MIDVGDTIEHDGEKKEIVSFFSQEMVVLKGRDGAKVSVPFMGVIHNLMQQTAPAQKEDLK